MKLSILSHYDIHLSLELRFLFVDHLNLLFCAGYCHVELSFELGIDWASISD